MQNWKGTEASGSARGPIKVVCADGAPCTNVTIEDFAMWTESGEIVYAIRKTHFADNDQRHFSMVQLPLGLWYRLLPEVGYRQIIRRNYLYC